jgi:hypothetical protein
MPYKNYEKQKENSRQRYIKKRKEILKYQIKRWIKKYKTDPIFRERKLFRGKSVKRFKLTNLKCKLCETNKDLQRHHPDYNDPYIIIVLCRKCHTNIHYLLKNKKIEKKGR